MELTPEVIVTGFVGLLVILGAVGRYLRSLHSIRPTDSVLTGIGMELGNREQTERLIGIADRIAVALEALADKRAIEMKDMHQEVLDRLDRREEQEESRRRPEPPRRR